jgi:hypothetical protein
MTMKATTAIKTFLRSSLVLGVALAAGCASSDDQKTVTGGPAYPDQAGAASSFFSSDSGNNHSNAFVNAQATAGAREDATIEPFHFSGTQLNELGTEKLTRMVPDEAGTDVTVYVNVPADDFATARRDAVAAYLGTCGVDAAHLQVKIGYNPNVTASTADGLTNLPKTDTGTGGALTNGSAQATGSQTVAH